MLQIPLLGNFSRKQSDQATSVYCYHYFGLIPNLTGQK